MNWLKQLFSNQMLALVWSLGVIAWGSIVLRRVNVDRVLRWLSACFSDKPLVSFGRVLAFIWSIAVIYWVSLVLWRTNGLPEMHGLHLVPYGFYPGGKAVGKVQEWLGQKPESVDVAAAPAPPEGKL